ncbi:hypothetical protein LH51_06955 [Nitrincola sp. A-D6]|nr:hypothetical protein LH51_06955 [Nitrincola sp. A-D6]
MQELLLILLLLVAASLTYWLLRRRARASTALNPHHQSPTQAPAIEMQAQPLKTCHWAKNALFLNQYTRFHDSVWMITP